MQRVAVVVSRSMTLDQQTRALIRLQRLRSRVSSIATECGVSLTFGPLSLPRTLAEPRRALRLGKIQRRILLELLAHDTPMWPDRQAERNAIGALRRRGLVRGTPDHGYVANLYTLWPFVYGEPGSRSVLAE